MIKLAQDANSQHPKFRHVVILFCVMIFKCPMIMHIIEHDLHTMRLRSITVALFLHSNIWRHNSNGVMGVPSIHVTA